MALFGQGVATPMSIINFLLFLQLTETLTIRLNVNLSNFIKQNVNRS